jgi:hypothetical protein
MLGQDARASPGPSVTDRHTYAIVRTTSSSLS